MNKQQITQEEFDKKVENRVCGIMHLVPTLNRRIEKKDIKKSLKERYEIK